MAVPRGPQMRSANRSARVPAGVMMPGAASMGSLTARVLAVREAASGRVVRGPERERHEPDYLLLIAVVLLAALGSLMIYSSSASAHRPDTPTWTCSGRSCPTCCGPSWGWA